jgi:hypothetical protein
MDSTDTNIGQRTVYYLLLAVVVIGSIGNVIALIVCSRSKLQNTFFHIYFRFRILIDTLNMFNAFNYFISNGFGYWIERVSNDLCRLIAVLYYIPASSAWIDVCISMDRWVSIKFPTRFMFRKKRWFQWTVCFGFLIKDFLLYGQLYLSSVDLTYSNNSNKSSMIKKECVFYNIDLLHLIDLLNASLLPFILIFSLTLMMLKCVYDSKKHLSNNNQRQTKLAITVISMNLIFFVTNFPLTVFYLAKGSNSSDKLTLTILLVIYYANFGSSFYINVAVNSLFREEFMTVFYCRRSANTNARSSVYL